MDNEFTIADLPTIDQMVHDLAVAYTVKVADANVTPAEFAELYKQNFEQIYCQFDPDKQIPNRILKKLTLHQ